MSNINSCSLPQTPKEDFQSKKQNQLTILTDRSEVTQKVFEYRPTSQREEEDFLNEDMKQDLSNYEEVKQVQEERMTLKEQDYGMRLFTGSESLLREFKVHTPKESHHVLAIDSNDHSVKGLSS